MASKWFFRTALRAGLAAAALLALLCGASAAGHPEASGAPYSVPAWDSELTAPAGLDLEFGTGGTKILGIEADPRRVWIRQVNGRPVVRLRMKGDVVLAVTTVQDGVRVVERMLVHGVSRDEWTRMKGGRTLRPKPAPSPEPVFDSAPAPEAAEILRLVNAERGRRGLAPLKLMPDLCSAAAVRAKEIQVRTAHERPDGRPCWTVLERRGSCTAENIAAGQRSEREVMDSWMKSRGHRENILSPGLRELGVAHAVKRGSKYVHYWVQLFRG